MSEREIAAVVSELTALEGAAVQRAWAPRTRAVVLRLRVPGESHLLLLSAEPGLTRLHLVEERPRPADGPAPFQDALRAEIEGLRVDSIRQILGDRIVEIALLGRHERRLIAELMGRAGNLYILDEEGTILHAAVVGRAGHKGTKGSLAEGSSLADDQVPRVSSKAERDNRPGRPYQPPSGRPVTSQGSTNRFEEASGAGTRNAFPLNEAVEAHYTPVERERDLEQKRRGLERPARRALARVKRALARLDEEERRASRAGLYRRYGELLKSALHKVERGATEVSVVDWFEEGQPETKVPLRADQSAKENMERYFRLSKKLSSATARIDERREELLSQRAALAGLVEMLEEAESIDALEEASRLAESLGLRVLPSAPPKGRSSEKGAGRVPYKRFSSVTGRTILVGRGSRDNDELTFKVARGNDLWVHVRGHPGSHVVVPMGKDEEPDEQTLLDAGTLAAHFSRARGETLVDLAWTRRKHVKKPKGAPPGLVTVSGERGLMLRLEPDRLERLLRSSRQT